MDIDLLIALVHKRTSLWDRSDKFHNKRADNEKNWREISAEMGINEKTLRKKWKYLRDRFSVELGKVPRDCTGNKLLFSHTPKFSHFNSMLFLKDEVTPILANFRSKKPPEVNSRWPPDYIIETVNVAPNSNLSVFSSENDNEDHNASNDNLPSSTIRNKRRSQSSLNETDTLRIESLETESDLKLQKNIAEDDEHLHFFRSILPHVREIPRHRILSFRTQIQELVEEYAYSSYNKGSVKIEDISAEERGPVYIRY